MASSHLLSRSLALAHAGRRTWSSSVHARLGLCAASPRHVQARCAGATGVWRQASASTSASGGGTCAAGLNVERRRDVVRFGAGLVGRSPVAAAGRANKLRHLSAGAKKKEEDGVGEGDCHWDDSTCKEAVVDVAVETNDVYDGTDGDEMEEEGGVEHDDDFDDEGGDAFEDDELMQTDENGELINVGDTDIDAEEAIFTADTEWGELALKSLQSVLQDDEFDSSLEIFSFRVSVERRRIYISIDNVKDKFGSPTLDQLSSVSRKFNVVLEEGGFPDDVSLEVASPGAERQMRLPGDLERFRTLTMRVTYAASAGGQPGAASPAEGQTTHVMLLTDLDEAGGTSTWKLADVSENRPQAKKGQGMNRKQREWRLKLAVGDISKANLFIDI